MVSRRGRARAATPTKPRTTTAAASVAGGAIAWAATANLDNQLLVRVVVFAVVAILGVAVPSLRLTDPRTRRPLNADSSISSVILSLGAALAASAVAGDLPIPDAARGFLTFLVSMYSGTTFPSVLGTALGRDRTPLNRVDEPPAL